MIGDRFFRLGEARLRKWRLTKGLRLRSDEFELYRFDDGDRDPSNFVPYRFFKWRIRPTLNAPEARVLTENKWIFHKLLQSHGVPHPRTLALYDNRIGITADGAPCSTREQLEGVLRERQPRSLVMKPTDGLQGRGVVVLTDIDYSTGEAKLGTGEATDLWKEIHLLHDSLEAGGSGYIFQERISQHPRISRINPYTVNTLRIVTHMTSQGDVVTPFAAVRFGRAGSMVDSWDKGGISAGVDIETGLLNAGVIKPSHGGQWVTSHPDAGIEFVGMKVPMWEESVELCRSASRLFPGVRSIGWDLIVTRDGPVILEANEDWDLIMVQVHTDGWLAIPDMRADLEAVGIAVPDRIPSAREIAVRSLRRRAAKAGRRLATGLDAPGRLRS